jgi:hypothetical protein
MTTETSHPEEIVHKPRQADAERVPREVKSLALVKLLRSRPSEVGGGVDVAEDGGVGDGVVGDELGVGGDEGAGAGVARQTQ